MKAIAKIDCLLPVGETLFGDGLQCLRHAVDALEPEDVFDELRNERKPVLCNVSGSPVIREDIEVIVMPLRRDDSARELALAIYDF